MMYDIGLTVFNGLAWAMATFLVAAGLTLIFGILHILNFAHGGFFMIGAYVSYTVMLAFGAGLPLWVFMIGAMAAAVVVGLLGWAVDMFVFRRLRDVEDAYSLIATYALLLVCGGAVQLIWGLNYLSVMPPPSLNSVVFIGDVFMPTYTIFVILSGVVAYIGLELLINRTQIGQLIRVVAVDPWMARLLGLNVTRIYLVTVIFSFAMAGVAGALLMPNQSLSPELGGIFLLQAFGVVIVGGMGSIRGAFLAALLLGMIESFGTYLFPQYPGIFFLLALAVILLVKPSGIMGKEQTA
ncbi:branched-chain amino acid ABC transporter permease [Lutimaribacter sp. EGI FJ00015]|uniref:Branched-chain amino acid ABC transporter permease n=1 Tax=Lutimaribacter degradans TaxID=2945989 RepID=A0ACC5ZZW3_9RHOB|nr:branched-chain amino acid ABC transporter permease [Lutimaribacter sp. EGI FJ00013]MCM2563592.1 branched-chain amino acid ABC transporter permease [Lutimaribacter sp. EGI FJ00013]MCO0614745.1 branched-chain amino acid ABC transporter permease [Lutimaribacter sp. EGI FJ00015]MCO0637415.1 branched-chain amino acid ABC transporter permease [Lutimaribacter sp. EGI FJ00014]